MRKVHDMLYPTAAVSLAAVIIVSVLGFVAPLIIESTLVIRLTAVYPRESTPKFKFWSILLVPIIFKIIRVINTAIYLHRYIATIYDAGLSIYSLATAQSLWGDWQIKFDWILQAVDNTSVKTRVLFADTNDIGSRFVSFMFLRRLRQTGEGVVPSSKMVNYIIFHTVLIHLLGAIASRLRALFLIALSNFVFPVILNIIQLGLIFSSSSSFFRTTLVYNVNCYVTIIGVVFATVWSIGSRKLEEASLPPARSLLSKDSTANA